MKFPEFLTAEKNGKKPTIGFPAPSFGCSIEPYYSAFQNAKKKLQKRGVLTEDGPNAYKDLGIGISNTPQKCAEEFMQMYVSGTNHALISCGGGELMCEILPYIDFEKLKSARPKWFMGYSDNTNLTFLLTTNCDTASIYGPCAAAFGMEPWHPAIEDAFSLLMGKKLTMKNYPLWEKESKKDETHPYEPYHVTEPFVFAADEKEISVSGRLIGGCLDCLSKLVGTRFDKVSDFVSRYRMDGILWFLECCDLNVMEIRRCLWNLREAGWFEYASGFLIGRPMHYDEPMFGLDRHTAVTGILSELDVPVIMDLDIGHLPPMMPLICGSFAEAGVSNGQFEIRMELR